MTLSRTSLVGISLLACTAFGLLACSVKVNDTAPTDRPVPEKNDPGTDGGDLGECAIYTPTAIVGSKSGTFASGADVVSIPLPATDVGGGLLEVTISAQTQAMEVAIWLSEGEKKDEARMENAVLDDQTGTFYVRLHGGKAYELRAHATNFRDDRTNGYTISWKYEPLVDCYEDNDTRESAKRIPINTPIKAYLHVGIGPDDSHLVGPTADDWYTFELTEPKTAQLRVNVPGDNTAYFSVRNADDVEVTCDDPNFGMGTSATDTAEEMTSCVATLAPGKYWIKGAISNSEYPGTGIGEPVPPSWNTAYTLTVETK
ncbi:MAG: hypothetical protein LC111_14720 [Bacteroidia bacterium]|nr:hypothetical protein [Bacteroidia bacterium]